MKTMNLKGINSVSILWATCGSPQMYPTVDPYYQEAQKGSWHEAARSDGRSYGGEIEKIDRKEGESDRAFELRILERERVLSKELGVR